MEWICKDRYKNLSFAATLVFLSTILSSPVYSQIVPNDTLGNENSRLTRRVNVRGGFVDRVDKGAIHRSNPFHSFREFNVQESQKVYFDNLVEVENILTRV